MKVLMYIIYIVIQGVKHLGISGNVGIVAYLNLKCAGKLWQLYRNYVKIP